MDKRWFLYSCSDKLTVKELSEELNIPESLATILVQRGIKTYDEARLYFRPTLEGIHDPFLMKNMEKSVDRVEKAIASQEKILIFGDYDVDGISAVALMYLFLKQYVSDIEYYVPDRYGEGYGMSVQSVEYAHEHHFTLMIVLDCGIKCHQEIDLANQYDIDVIVCDHHLPDETLPEAYTILDPKLPDCPYPCKDLSGCGVGFKLVQAISQRRNIPFAEIGKYIDLLALSIASDIVPIVGENRTFTYFGLKLMNIRPRQAIESLLSFSKIVRKEDPNLPPKNTVFTRVITVTDLVFYVGPRINAAGRMATGRNSVHLLIAENEDQVLQLGELVDMHNNERRELDTKITQEVIEMVSSNSQYEKKRSLVMYNSTWSKGVIGIVASRLVEHFYKPSIVLASSSDDLITGSARSVKGFDLYAALCQCSDLLEHFGGHTFAAGLSLKHENLDAFIEKFEDVVSERIDENSIIRTIDVDAEIDLKDITVNFYNIVKNFAPFGPCNLAPVFMTKHVYDTGFARIVGQNHLKLAVFQKNCRSFPINAIGFGLGQHHSRILKGEPFHICYQIDINVWQGNTSLQLMIKDVKFDFLANDVV